MHGGSRLNFINNSANQQHKLLKLYLSLCLSHSLLTALPAHPSVLLTGRENLFICCEWERTFANHIIARALSAQSNLPERHSLHLHRRRVSESVFTCACIYVCMSGKVCDAARSPAPLVVVCKKQTKFARRRLFSTGNWCRFKRGSGEWF